MRPTNKPREISIKVPAPFAGVEDLGFTAQYPAQDPFAPLRDVPLLIEGPPDPMRELAQRLRLLRDHAQSAHTWTDPVLLSDELLVMAFRDQSLQSGPGESQDSSRRLSEHILDFIRPVVFPFLEDCALIAGLRLSDRIDMRVRNDAHEMVQLSLRREQIVQPNGTVYLFGSTAP